MIVIITEKINILVIVSKKCIGKWGKAVPVRPDRSYCTVIAMDGKDSQCPHYVEDSLVGMFKYKYNVSIIVSA